LQDLTERDELRTVVAGLEDRATGMEAQIAELRRKEDSRQKSQMRQGLQERGESLPEKEFQRAIQSP
jgi:hypothetical protein